MTLSEYLVGRRIVLRSEHRKDWVIDRIKSSVRSPFAIGHHGVAGFVFLGRLRLAWEIPFFSNGFRPVFRGKFVEKGRATELHVVFGATTFLRLFYALWYGLLLVMTATGLSEGDVRQIGPFLAIMPLFAMVLPGVHFLLNSNADDHCDAMLDLLSREADLRPVTAQ